jgi:beta-lactamase class A
VTGLAALSACATTPTTGTGVPVSSATPVASSPVAASSMVAPPTSPPPTPTPTPTSAAPTASGLTPAQAAAQLQALVAQQPAGSVSVAALNTATGAQSAGGATSGMWTASAYKLFVLETLLWRLQQSGQSLSSNQLALATRMIEASDNVAGYSLFEAAGGNAGLAAAAKAFGMTRTIPGRIDPTFTTTSATDYLQLLKNLVTNGPLNAVSQSLTLNLMRHVQAGQRWGVGVVADPGTVFANKNGWLAVDNSNGPGEVDNGRWIVSSVGVVTVGGQQLLMAVFSEHQPSMSTGVTLVQTLARALTPAVTTVG